MKKNKYRHSNNHTRGLILEKATKIALKRLDVKFNNTTNNYQNGKVPDYTGNTFAIEDKNWNCEKYWIGWDKATKQILNRFTKFHSKAHRILIISKPRWLKDVRKTMKAMGIYLIELGYVVTKFNFSNAVNTITRELNEILNLGIKYPNIDRKFIKSVLHLLDITSERSFSLLENHYNLVSHATIIVHGVQ